ncbi:hypothetical protein CVT24_011272 [Panaeolus cyanescens]|uniref:Uncharacterized protein n=1 Tax=Panaeolus cyanescens TaxID=181874 RepID=A0A409VLR2_9AGAR|nr:hypothetical protein CVT24_011272 [Panaeolus cyanescens]
MKLSWFKPTPAPPAFGAGKVLPNQSSLPLQEDDFWELPPHRLTAGLTNQIEANFYERCPPEKRPPFMRDVTGQVATSSASAGAPEKDAKSLTNLEKGSSEDDATEANTPDVAPSKPLYDESLFKAIHKTFTRRIWLSGLLLLVSAGMTTGLYVRTGVIGNIFRKSLRLSGKSRSEHTVGKITTMISQDATHLDTFAAYAHYLWVAPIELIIGIALLIRNLGVSALVGFGVLIGSMPFQAILIAIMFQQRKKGLKITDQRLRLTNEILQGIRLIKIYGWEKFYSQKIMELRKGELGTVRASAYAISGFVAMFTFVPILASILSFIVYALLGNDLNIAIIFTSLQLFNVIRVPLMIFPFVMSAMTDAMISLGRISSFLEAEELPDLYKIQQDFPDAVQIDGDFEWETVYRPPSAKDFEQEDATAIREAYTKEQKEKKEKEKAAKMKQKKRKAGDEEKTEGLPIVDPSVGEKPVGKEPSEGKEEEKIEERPFSLKSINITVPRGAFVAIIGTVGSGKSSLLQAIIGEMRRTRGEVTLGGSVAYVPQSPWIRNDTIRQNVLFGQENDEAKFRRVIHACGLDHDLTVFPHAEETEIGEKGITLSGGQKARVSLARAAYHDSDVVLLDGPLSAVDSYVGKHILQNCLLEGPMSNRTRILVTHALHVLDKVDYIYVMDNGSVIEKGTYQELMASGALFAKLIEEYGSKEASNKVDTTTAVTKTELEEEKVKKNALMQLEERNTGSVSWNIYKQYFENAGGLRWLPLLAFLLIVTEGNNVATTLVLGFWTGNTLHNFSQRGYMALYAGLGAGLALSTFATTAVFVFLGVIASMNLYNKAFKGVINSPSSFFDTTPIGRIISRLSKDQETIDASLPLVLRAFVSTLVSVFGTIALVFYTFPYLGIIFLPLSVLYYMASVYYRRNSVETQRLDSVLRSTLFASYSESLTGLSTIRAYRQQTKSIEHAEHGLDKQNRAYMMTITMQRWLALRLEFFGNVLVLGIALFGAGLRGSVNPAKISVVLTYTLACTSHSLLFQANHTYLRFITELISMFAQTEQNMNSVERVLHYAELEPEENSNNTAEPPDSWPEGGAISFKNVKLVYRKGLPLVLKGVTFAIQPAEKIGIVGRTGSGKSTLIQALLRLVELQEGIIEIDDVDIAQVPLHTLRSRMALVPQDNSLFLGTLRDNIDPQHGQTDADLISVLQRASLLPTDGPIDPAVEAKFSLDAVVGDEGSNYSAGEKQLLALCRALVKNSRIIILDEATSNVDVETDAKIQRTIQKEFASSTLLCIAHRLNTIAHYDRVLVMGDGHVAEFDTVLNLFDNSTSIFRSLCDEANLSLSDILKIRQDYGTKAVEILCIPFMKFSWFKPTPAPPGFGAGKVLPNRNASILINSSLDLWELPPHRLTGELTNRIETNFYERCAPEKRPPFMRSTTVIDTQEKQAETDVEGSKSGSSGSIYDESLFKAIHKTFIRRIWSSGVLLLISGEFLCNDHISGYNFSFIRDSENDDSFGQQGSNYMAHGIIYLPPTFRIGAEFGTCSWIHGSTRDWFWHWSGICSLRDASLWVSPIQLGVSALVGLGVLVFAMPFQGILVAIMYKQRQKGLKITDQRVRLTTEILHGIRLIKTYGWESFYTQKIMELRKGELGTVQASAFAVSGLIAMFTFVPILASILSFIVYALTGHDLNIAVIFTSLQLFNVIRVPLLIFPMVMSAMTDAVISLGRISTFLTAEELPGQYKIDLELRNALQINGDFEWETVYRPPTAKDFEQEDVTAIREAYNKDQKEKKEKAKEEVKKKKRAVRDTDEKTEEGLPTVSPTIREKAPDLPVEEKDKPEDKPFSLKSIDVVVPRGSFVAIVGTIGSGKSSLLQAIIGEMRRSHGEVVVGGSVAYVPQSPWIRNDTVRQNILFGQPDDQAKFRQVIHACGLDHDLKIFSHGEQTEIGEKGITLSGGQKARVSLARAAYHDSDIVLLDDPLSAVDAYVGKHILENCLLSGPMAQRTRVLVTHALHVLDKVDYIYVMDHGSIIERGTYKELVANGALFSRLVEEYGSKETVTKGTRTAAISKADLEEEQVKKNALMQLEERNTGSVSWHVYAMYFRNAGGLRWLPLLLFLLIIVEGHNVATTLVLGFWTGNTLPHFSQRGYMALYAGLGAGLAISTFSMTVVVVLLGIVASMNLYRRAFGGVLSSPLSFFDTTPIGRIVSRLSKDQETIDAALPIILQSFVTTLFSVFGTIGLVFYTFPYLGIIFAPLAVLYHITSVYYRRNSVETKRLDSLLRSALYSSYSESLTGLTTIRAYRQQTRAVSHAEHGLDMENRAYMMTITMQRWLALRLEFFGNVLVLGIALFGAGLRGSVNPAKISVVLTYTLTGMICCCHWFPITKRFPYSYHDVLCDRLSDFDAVFWLIILPLAELISMFAQTEQNMNSVERVLHYAQLDPEEDRERASELEIPPSWPNGGAVSFRNVKLAYRSGLPLVLKGVTFDVRPAEKVGIVGRTGSGKSTLIQALLRLVPIQEGIIDIDSVNILGVPLQTLRSRIALVPQDNSLFLGTLRENLDPQHSKTDAELISVLQRASLLPKDGPTDPTVEAKFSLDAVVTDEGSNYSAGEKQLLALCRALVKNSRIIILDEATSNVDVETDSKVQRTIQTEFASSTLLCIAHRLNTVGMILVMDDGHVAEFDTVLNLFDNPNSIFRSLCDEANLTRNDILKIRQDHGFN